MDGDRVASLIVRLAFDRGLDFGAADPRNPQWTRRLSAFLHEQERRIRLTNVCQTITEAFDLYWNGHQEPQAREVLRTNILKLNERRLKLLQPWVKIDPAAVTSDHVAEMADNWRRVYGDPADPETQKRIDASVAWLKSNTAPRK